VVEAEVAKAKGSIRKDLSAHETPADHVIEGVRQLLSQAKGQEAAGAKSGAMFREEIRGTNVTGHDKPLNTPVAPGTPSKNPTR
jgi:hypothetical protein